MLTIFPEFYDDFRCRAKQCRHSCCLGWEIDIDPDTARLYQELTVPISEEIRRHMGHNENGSFFRLTADKRCPFLQQDGLCRLILTLGEDSLCEICTMHPRFFTYLDDIEIAGVGLCCEESVSLLLDTDSPLHFYLFEDELPADEPIDFAALLEFLELPPEAAKLPPLPADVNSYLAATLQLLEKTEPIDTDWTKLLGRLRDWLQAGTELTLPDERQLNKIYQYILYRQLQEADTTAFASLAEFARCNTYFIAWTAQVISDLPEAVRLWSAQIEYDTDNVAFLLNSI